MALRSRISQIGKSQLGLVSRLQSTVAAADFVSDEYARAKPYSQIPSPRGLPLLGNALLLGNKENQHNAIQFHKDLIKQLGPIYKIRLPSMDMVFVTEAEDSKTLYTSGERYPQIATFEIFERVRTKHLGHLYPTPGLLTNGEEWQKVRSLVQQDMMRPKSAMFYIDDLSNIMDEMIEKIERMKDDKNEMVIMDTLYEFALDAVGVMFIGSNLGVLQGSQFGKDMITKIARLFELFLVIAAIPAKIDKYVPQYKEYLKLSEDVYIMGRDKINAAIEKHKVDGSLDGTILAKMIERCGPDSQIPHVMANDAMIAGIDTTGNSAGILLYHLATNPDKQEKLYEEILRVVGKDGKMTESALTDMRYLKACQTESMRMVPAAIGTARSAGKDMVLSGYQVPKGTFVLQLGALNQTNEQHFKNADSFMPERWIRGCPEHQKLDNPFAHIPFGHGPRACVGQRFARLELYMAMFKLVQKYKISYHGEPLSISYLGLGHIREPLNLRFEKRE